MKGIFNPDSPFSQFMGRIADLCIINVLMLLCCLPVITIGAAVAAAHKATQDLVYDNHSGVVRPFFQAFKSSFKQATVVWLVEVFLIAALAGYFLLVVNFTADSTQTILFIILGIAAIILFSLTSYIYPLMARYENTLKQHLLNSILLVLFNIPRTLALLLIALIPVAFAYFFTPIFIQSIIFFVLFGCAFFLLIHSYLLKAIFDDLEAKKAIAEEKAAAEAAAAETEEESGNE